MPSSTDSGTLWSVRWHCTAARECQHRKPHGKPPMDAFGKLCTWGGDKGWLDSKDQPHTVVRNAKCTALSTDAAWQREGG